MRSRLVILATLGLLTAGCLPTNISELMTAAGKDPASVCINVSTVYGTLKVARSNLTAGALTCNMDGLSIAPRPATP